MSTNNPIENLEPMEHKKIFKWSCYVFGAALLIMLGVFAFYFSHFHYGPSRNHGTWGEFGDFIGGTLNPILSFLALIALLLTIVLQSKQLDLSTKELKETKEALKESAISQKEIQIAQSKQAKALEISAKMTAITKLLEQNEETLKDLELRKSSNANSISERTRPFSEKKKQLRDDLDSLYSELTNMS